MLKNIPIRYVEEKDLGFHEHFLDPYLYLECTWKLQLCHATHNSAQTYNMETPSLLG